ncbi:hypothetical protein LTR27_011285 [Elasticomyces elasticus]|nr:hypothetical protein LTR27_011285 [Elasticomyces elasticus]
MQVNLHQEDLRPLDGLPVEIRIEIFKLAQCHSSSLSPIRRPGREQYPRECVDVSLLVALVNDSQFSEVYEAFYGGNFFRLSASSQLYDLAATWKDTLRGPLAHITHLGLDFHDETPFLSKEKLETDVGFCSTLPKLRTLEITCDILDHETTVREHLTLVDWVPTYEMFCTAVGSYAVRYSPKLLVVFSNENLVRDWLAMKRYRRDRLADVWRENVGGWFPPWDRLDGVGWMSIHDVGAVLDISRRAVRGSIALHPRSQEPMANFLQAFRPCKHIHLLYERMAAGVSFMDIDEGAHDSQMLELVSDLLNLNSRAFPLLIQEPLRWSKWSRWP